MRFLGIFAWLLALVAQPAFAADLPPQLQSLERRLAALAIENPGEYGFAAMDLASGDIVSVNGNQPFPMASTMKIAVAAAYLAQVDAGRRSLDDTIAGVSAWSLMDRMITHSDNRATDLLISSLGGPVMIDNWIRSHQLSGIRVDRNIATLLSDRRDLRDIRDSSTPVAMIGLLRVIDQGDALSPRSRAILLDMMARCETGTNRIPALMPAGVRVEHKTGTLNGYTGDVGFLTYPDGRRIAVVFFARYGENRPAVISTAARAIYEGFGAPGLAGSPLMQARSYGAPGIPARTPGVAAFAPAGAAVSAPSVAAAQAAPAAPPASGCSLGGGAVQAEC